MIAPGIGAGPSAPAGWRSLADLPSAIIVGLTGVGKSTTLAALAQKQPGYTLLPNRRDLTDRLIIPAVQAAEGAPIEPVSDRSQRFAYTRRYRERYPGGMSHALGQLQIAPAQMGSFLLFDGLRGADEVSHAVTSLPRAHFVALHAPDRVRVERLLQRNDRFDQVALPEKGEPQQAWPDLAALGALAAQALFSDAEQAALLSLVQQGDVTADELRAKLRIVIEERRNYDPYAAIDLLQTQAADRTLVIDTSTNEPDQVVARLVQQLKDWRLLI